MIIYMCDRCKNKIPSNKRYAVAIQSVETGKKTVKHLCVTCYHTAFMPIFEVAAHEAETKPEPDQESILSTDTASEVAEESHVEAPAVMPQNIDTDTIVGVINDLASKMDEEVVDEANPFADEAGDVDPTELAKRKYVPHQRLVPPIGVDDIDDWSKSRCQNKSKPSKHFTDLLCYDVNRYILAGASITVMSVVYGIPYSAMRKYFLDYNDISVEFVPTQKDMELIQLAIQNFGGKLPAIKRYLATCKWTLGAISDVLGIPLLAVEMYWKNLPYFIKEGF